MNAGGQKTCIHSLLITVILVIVYCLGRAIEMPFVDSPILGRKVSILLLGIAPFISGFFIVEIISFLVPSGRRLRSGGIEGRGKLNRIALQASLFICVFQSLAVAFSLERAGATEGPGTWPGYGWIFRILVCVTLTAGAGLVYWLAQLISRRGIANGFCVLIAVDILVPLLRSFGLGEDLGLAYRSEYFPLAAVALVALFIYFKRTVRFELHRKESAESATLDLPTFPQGIIPLTSIGGLVGLAGAIQAMRSSRFIETLLSSRFLPMVSIVWIVVCSIVGVWMFSSSKRIANNLPFKVELDDRFRRLLRNQSIWGVAILVACLAFPAIVDWRLTQTFMFNYANMIALVAIAMDVFEQWRFSWEKGESAALIELDNPHLASYIKGTLQRNGIDAVVQTYHYRRLLFFFGPLMKMRVLVAAEDYEKAREQMDWNSISIL